MIPFSDFLVSNETEYLFSHVMIMVNILYFIFKSDLIICMLWDSINVWFSVYVTNYSNTIHWIIYHFSLIYSDISAIHEIPLYVWVCFWSVYSVAQKWVNFPTCLVSIYCFDTMALNPRRTSFPNIPPAWFLQYYVSYWSYLSLNVNFRTSLLCSMGRVIWEDTEVVLNQ